MTLSADKARISIPLTLLVSVGVGVATAGGTWYVSRYRIDEMESASQSQTEKIEALANAVSELTMTVRLNEARDTEQQSKIEQLAKDATTDRATLSRIAADVAVIRDRIERRP